MNGTIDAMARAIIDKVYPVNVIVEFSLETDPNTAIGCGTQWERFAAGRALIGRSDTYAVGWEGGAAQVTIGIDQIPSHDHSSLFANGDVDYEISYGERGTLSSNCGAISHKGTTGDYHLVTGKTGGGYPHNNMQPSRAVDRWVRVA